MWLERCTDTCTGESDMLCINKCGTIYLNAVYKEFDDAVSRFWLINSFSLPLTSFPTTFLKPSLGFLKSTFTNRVWTEVLLFFFVVIWVTIKKVSELIVRCKCWSLFFLSLGTLCFRQIFTFRFLLWFLIHFFVWKFFFTQFNFSILLTAKLYIL